MIDGTLYPDYSEPMLEPWVVGPRGTRFSRTLAASPAFASRRSRPHTDDLPPERLNRPLAPLPIRVRK